MLKEYKGASDFPFSYVGPDLAEGAMPAVLYLALSAKESLYEDPFCQPVKQLCQYPLRVFSADLPFHGENFVSKGALEHWAHHLAQGDDVISSFLDKLEVAMFDLLTSGIVTRLGVMGLSRGGLLINHLAARVSQICALVSFAPLTDLSTSKDFGFLSLCPIIEKLNLASIVNAVCMKPQRIYIGNRDQRVYTDRCYAWARSMVESAWNQGIRSPHIELVLRPSIGRDGHGTSKESFEEGATWLSRQLLL